MFQIGLVFIALLAFLAAWALWWGNKNAPSINEDADMGMLEEVDMLHNQAFRGEYKDDSSNSNEQLLERVHGIREQTTSNPNPVCGSTEQSGSADDGECEGVHEAPEPTGNSADDSDAGERSEADASSGPADPAN